MSDEKTAVALYDYTAGEDNELSFVAGEKILGITFVSADWWQGYAGGKWGLCKLFFFINKRNEKKKKRKEKK